MILKREHDQPLINQPGSRCWWIDYDTSAGDAILKPDTDRMFLKSDVI